MKRKLLGLLAAVAFSSAVQADIISQWNFNSPSPDNNTATGTTLASAGSGTASTVVIPASTTFFAGSSTDPALTDNSGWSVAGFPAQGTGNRTAGVRFNADTMLYNNITISWDQRASNTGSKYARFQYTTDGGANWIDGALNTISSAGFLSYSANLSSIPGVNSNPNFGFRVVSEFAPSTSAYEAANSPTSSYNSSTGNWRFDMVTINGSLTSVPEPAVLLTNGILGFAVASGIVIIRRRKTVA